MKRTKILYVITKSVWGGAQRYVIDIAAHLPKEQFAVTVAAGGNGPLFSRLAAEGIPTIRIPHLKRDIRFGAELSAFAALFKIIKKEQPDIVHLNSSKIGGVGALAARLASFITGHKLLVVFTVHGWAFNEDRPQWQKFLIRAASRFSALFQDRMIHIAKIDLAATLRLRIAPARKCALIPLGIIAPAFLRRNSAREFLSEKIGHKIPEDAILIGAIAELTKNKGLMYLLDANKQIKFQIPNSKFQTIIVGEGEERETLERQIRALGLEEVVRLAGFIPDAARYIKAFDIFVLPSLKEGLPYTLLEAQTAGIPIVASDVGGILDIMKREKNGILVPPKNADALAAAIIALLGTPPAIQQQENFSLGEMIKKTITLYDEERTKKS